MVFATEFNPTRQNTRQNTRGRISPSANASSAAVAVSGMAKQEAANSNVVLLPAAPSPLNIGHPAVRVRLDENKSLSLPKRPKLPLSLQLLNRFQQGSTVITTLLVTGALAMYGSTVYIDKSTNHALLQLDSLQGESQQLTSANESIKQSLAEQASKENSGLEPYESGDVLFLQPEPVRASPEPVAPMAEMPAPLGY